jgi:hypothetical protein
MWLAFVKTLNVNYMSTVRIVMKHIARVFVRGQNGYKCDEIFYADGEKTFMR